MKADDIMANVERRLPELAKRSYAPIDAELARLIDLADKMPPAVFFREMELALERVPALWELMDARPIQDELETAIGEAIIGGIEQTI
jgi:hypothetical protein